MYQADDRILQVLLQVCCETNALATNTPRIQIHRGECESARQVENGAAYGMLKGCEATWRGVSECRGEVWGEVVVGGKERAEARCSTKRLK